LKLVVSIPTNGMMYSETCHALLNAMHVTKTEGVWYVFGRTAYVHQSRNDVLDAVVDSDFTHILFVDADMLFPMHGINILASRNKDIIEQPTM